MTEEQVSTEESQEPIAEQAVETDGGVDETVEEETDAGEDVDEGADEADEADDDEDDDEDPGTRASRVERLENEGEIAADYLEELLDIADLDGDLDLDVEGDRAIVSVVGAELTQLVGRRGEVLDALQELTRLAVYRETGERSRLMLDISGYRAGQRAELVKLADEMVAQVRDTGEPVSLKPMSPFERKVVHDAVAAAGLTSESEGVEPRRYVVVQPS